MTSLFRTLIVIALLANIPLAQKTWAVSPAVIKASDDFVRVADKIGSSVVNISTTKIVRRHVNNFWGQFFYGRPGNHTRTFKSQSLGSGIILSSDGQILTNAHVIADASEISVRLKNGDEYSATVLGEDQNVDLAVLQINPKKKLKAARLGNSDKVKVGQWAIALGNPFGLDHTVTVGVISAKGRSNVLSGRGAAKYQNFIQTDASINPGNSGGALINIQGEVIGINTAIYGKEGNIGIGFAIPINMAKRAVPDLIGRGRVVPPRLGFYTQDLSPKLVRALKLDNDQGVLLTDVAAGGPADKAGLRRGDVIVEVAGSKVINSAELKSRLYEIRPGEKIALTITRKSKRLNIRIIGEDPDRGRQGLWHGMRVEVNSKAKAIAKGLATSQGMIVTHVRPGSSADQIGMEALDVIIEINRSRIKTQRLWDRSTRKISENEDAVLLIIRGSKYAYIVIPGEE